MLLYMYISSSNISSAKFEQNIGRTRSKHSTRSTQIQNGRKRKPNPAVGHFRIFIALESKQMQKISVKHYFTIFMPDNWTGE